MSNLLAECVAAKLYSGKMTPLDICDVYGLSCAYAKAAYSAVYGRPYEEEPKKPRKQFTPEEMDEASEMWANGMSTAKIAEAFGISRGAFEAHVSRHRDMYPYRHHYKD